MPCVPDTVQHAGCVQQQTAVLLCLCLTMGHLVHLDC